MGEIHPLPQWGQQTPASGDKVAPIVMEEARTDTDPGNGGKNLRGWSIILQGQSDTNFCCQDSLSEHNTDCLPVTYIQFVLAKII